MEQPPFVAGSGGNLAKLYSATDGKSHKEYRTIRACFLGAVSLFVDPKAWEYAIQQATKLAAEQENRP